MTKLKLGPIHDDKPVKLTVELPAAPVSAQTRAGFRGITPFARPLDAVTSPG